MVFAELARMQRLLGGDIDREYCLTRFEDYAKTSEPDLLYNYTKVPTPCPAPAAPWVVCSADGQCVRACVLCSTGATTIKAATRTSAASTGAQRKMRRWDEEARGWRRRGVGGAKTGGGTQLFFIGMPAHSYP